MTRRFLLSLALTAILALAQPAPQPDHADVIYGPHARNVLDLWIAPAAKPTPLLVFIHGGGFVGGDKRNISAELVAQARAKGWSVASLNYRLAPKSKYPAAMEDARRAVQFLRWKSKQYNFDPQRLVASGGSAGAVICLWLGFRPDHANLASNDTLERQSTRFRALALVGAQTFLEPKLLKEQIGDATARHPSIPLFLGFPADQLYSEELALVARDIQAITWLSKDDPPAYLFYSEPRGPVAAGAKPGTGIHHLQFGLDLKRRMDALGIECIVRHRDELGGQPQVPEMIAFLEKHLR